MAVDIAHSNSSNFLMMLLLYTIDKKPLKNMKVKICQKSKTKYRRRKESVRY